MCTVQPMAFPKIGPLEALVVMALLRGMKVAMVSVSSKSKTTSFTGGCFLGWNP